MTRADQIQKAISKEGGTTSHTDIQSALVFEKTCDSVISNRYSVAEEAQYRTYRSYRRRSYQLPSSPPEKTARFHR